MILYYFLFNKVYKAYQKSGTSRPEIYATGVVSLIQIFTLFEIIAVFNMLNISVPVIDTKVLFGVAFCYIFLLYYYFTEVMSPNKIQEKIDEMPIKKQETINALMWVHVAITALGFVLIYNLRK